MKEIAGQTAYIATVRLNQKPIRVVALALGLAAAPAMSCAAGASAATVALTLPSIAQGTPATPAVPAPANDERANAQPIHSLPASINGTTVGATIEPGERESACGVQTASSVWYSLRASSAQRIALDLAAGGELDATIDVYHARALAARFGRLPADRRPRQGLALVQGLEERPLPDPRGRARELAARELLARSVPADPRDRAAGRAAALRRGQRAGRSHPEHQRGLLVHAARGRQLPDQPRQRDRTRVRQRRAVRARHQLLRRRRRRTARAPRCCRSTAAATACSPPVRARAGATASTSPRATPSAASSASTCRSPPPAPPKRRPGWRWATTPTRTGISAVAACGCCACTAWKSRAIPT